MIKFNFLIKSNDELKYIFIYLIILVNRSVGTHVKRSIDTTIHVLLRYCVCDRLRLTIYVLFKNNLEV